MRPTAAFSADVTTFEVPQVVTFTDESTGTPTQRRWDFGDGETSLEQNPTHKYYLAGSYSVTLKVVNRDGKHTLVKTDYLTGEETDDGQENQENRAEATRGERSQNPEMDDRLEDDPLSSDLAKKIDYSDNPLRPEIKDVYL